MPTLSLAMIVKNEGDTIERVLLSAKPLCEEIIVVDTGSTDDTVEKAKALGASVYHFDWIDDFAAARNYSFSLCTQDWILWLDGDDEIEPQDQTKILEVKQKLLHDELDAIFFTYQYPTISLSRERLLRRGATQLQWRGRIHEAVAGITPERSINVPAIKIQHKTPLHRMETKKERNINILKKCLEAGDRNERNLSLLVMELAALQRHNECIDAFFALLEVVENVSVEYQALCQVSSSYFATDKSEEGLACLARATVLDSCRAEAFGKIGIHYVQKKLFRQAIPFLRAAASIPRPTFGVSEDHFYTFLPYDFLASCYTNLGEFETAAEMTLEALKRSPPDKERVLQNLWYVANGIANQASQARVSRPNTPESLQAALARTSRRQSDEQTPSTPESQ